MIAGSYRLIFGIKLKWFCCLKKMNRDGATDATLVRSFHLLLETIPPDRRVRCVVAFKI